MYVLMLFRCSHGDKKNQILELKRTHFNVHKNIKDLILNLFRNIDLDYLYEKRRHTYKYEVKNIHFNVKKRNV